MLTLQLLGSLELRDPDGRGIRSVLAQPKRVGLLAYLVLRGRFSRRDSLLPVFWPELDEEHARAALRQAIHQLRRSLGAGVIVGRGDDEIGVAEGAIRCDAVEFSGAIEREEWEEALRLYGGDLLPGFALEGVPEYEQWLDTTRTTLRRDAARAAGECSLAAEARGDLLEAARWSRHQLGLTTADETVLRRLLEQLRDAGDRVGALAAYEEFRVELQRLYELEPAPETVALVAEILEPPATETPVVVAIPRTAHEAGQASPVPAEGPAAPLEPAAAERVAAPAAAAASPRWRWRARATTGIRPPATVGVLAVVTIALLGLIRMPFVSGATPDGVSIAVLPIEDISVDSSAQYIGHGMTEELISALGEISTISVTSGTTGHAYKGTKLPVREIGEKLGVDYVLEGSVQRDGDRLRVAIRLISIADGRQRWSESYDRLVSDVLEIRDDIGARVVEALQSHLSFSAPEVHDPAAYDDYLKARFLLRGRSMEAQTRVRVEQAIRHLTAATDRDPEFARAHAELADAYLALADFAAPGDALPSAKAAAERALELDESLAEAHLALANVRLTHDWDWAGAEAEYQRAIELDPDLPEARYDYARYLRVARRFDEAFAQTQRGLRLEHRGAHDHLVFAIRENERLATAHLFARRYPEAVAHARRALELEPHALGPRISLALASQMIGDHATAIETLEETREEFGDRSPVLWRLGDAYAQVGREEEARAILRLLRDRARKEYIPEYQIGLVHLGLGEVDEAIRSFESGIDSQPGWWATAFNGSPRYDGIREDPRFQRLLKRINAPG